ncbi:MAG: transcriptional regulator, Crp/Fnr family [Clostridiales bacterium]|nr:transcriptional regulator, Crp/Fnr family [Clostridiales bacterium]
MSHHQCLNCMANHHENCIKKVPIFSNLTTEEMVEVSLTTTQREYKKGETIYSEGEPSENLYVINNGKVKISKLSEEGKEQIIRILYEGDFMGELSLFTQSPYMNNAEALETTLVCIVNGKKINELIEKYPSVSLKIMKELSSRLEETERLIESIGLGSVEQRVAEVLLKMSDDNNTVNLSISKRDLAAHIGMSQETLSRKLSNFQEEGWIKQEGQRKIKILNRTSLEAISNI